MAPIRNFMTPAMNWGACVSQWSCVYAAKIETIFFVHLSVCMCVCVNVYIHEYVKVGGGTVWENTPVCGLTKLSFCT